MNLAEEIDVSEPTAGASANDVSAEDIREFRNAVRSVLGVGTDQLNEPDPDGLARWHELVDLGASTLCGMAEGQRQDLVNVAAAIARDFGAALSPVPFAATTAVSRMLSRVLVDSTDLGDDALDSVRSVLAGIASGDTLVAYGRIDAAGVARRVHGADIASALLLEDLGRSRLVLLDDPAQWTVRPVVAPFDVSRSIGEVSVPDLDAGIALGSDPSVGAVAGLLLAADTVGGLERALDVTVAYAAQRIAFGKPIGAFQAVQHRLADHAVSLRAMSLLVDAAADAFASGRPEALRLGLLAEVAVSDHALHLAHDLVQLTGGIGFTWEYGLHFVERRAQANNALGANPRRALTSLIGLGLGDADSSLDGAEDATGDSFAAYRREVRDIISQSAHPMRAEGVRVPVDDAEEAAIRTWLAEMYDHGVLGGGWPTQWGGSSDHHPMHDLIAMEELIVGGAYRPLDQVMLASHAVLTHGTEAQKAELLPAIRSGRHVWCQLFSEPDAGSDLASLRTKAVADGDGWLVSGQKTWSTDAQWADMGVLLARTDPEAQRHAGITAFVIPMDLPGIEIRPICEITGHAEFCEVFLNEVRVGPEHVLGDLNDGWRVVTAGLASERAFVGANAIQLQRLFDDLVALAVGLRYEDGTAPIDQPEVRIDLARLLARVEGVKAIVRDAVQRIFDDEEHPSDGPVAKLAYTELDVALTEAALAMIATASYGDELGDLVARWHHNFMWGRALTISGGASEIMRGLIARQLLGLPRA